MQYASTEERQEMLASIRDGVRAVVTRFDDDYWLERDDDGAFPHEFHKAMAEAGWLGITMPEEYGGARKRFGRTKRSRGSFVRFGPGVSATDPRQSF